MRLIDIRGREFGHITVLDFPPKIEKGVTYWFCRCHCGKEWWVNSAHLRTKTTSCGCTRTHGLAKHPIYRVWKDMRSRCSDENNQYYGGRGIKVCDSWQRNFQTFYDDMSPTYIAGYSIERIDVNKGYEPSNCTWIPRNEQPKNRRPWKFKEDVPFAHNKSTGVKGVYKAGYGDRYLVRLERFHVGTFDNLESAIKAKYAYLKDGTISDDAITQKTLTLSTGENLTFIEAAKRFGVKYDTIRWRYKRGKRGDQLVEKLDLCKPTQN